MPLQQSLRQQPPINCTEYCWRHRSKPAAAMQTIQDDHAMQTKVKILAQELHVEGS